MPDIDPTLQKALADEKQKRYVATDHDLADLIEKHKGGGGPEEKKEEEKKLTKEDYEKANNILSKSLGIKQKKEEKKADETDKEDSGEDAKAEDKKEDAEKKPEGTDEEKPKKDEKKDDKKIKVSRRPEVDPLEIATAAAARTAEQILSASSKERKEVPDKRVGVEDTLSEEERGELEVFQEMAKDNRFKELPRQYLAFLKKSEEYQRKWETEHPDQEFNPEASEHDAFFHKVSPKYPEIEHKKAIARLANVNFNSQEIEKLTHEQKRLKSELAVREMEPMVQQTKLAVLGEIIKGMDESVLAAIQKTNDFNKYAEENPVEADIIRTIAAKVEPFVEGLIHIDEDKQGRIDIDEKKESHREWARYLKAKEADLMKRSRAERTTEDGRLIITRGEYFNLPTASRAGYAFIDGSMLLQMRIAEESEKAKELYQREVKKLEAIAKARGWAKMDEKKVEQNGEKKEEKPPEKKEPLKSPESGSSVRIDTSGEAKPAGVDSFMESISRVLNRR